MTLIVETSNGSYVGYHTIVLVQSFEKIPDVHPFTHFSVKILG